MATEERIIPLTITSSYAKHWGEWEGVRELIQNWHDGLHSTIANLDNMPINVNTVQYKQIVSPISVTYEAFIPDERAVDDRILLGSLNYDRLSSKLKLINHNTALQKKILLLGYSEKVDRKEVIGQFGEGLKIGTLALVRKGFFVTIETARDQWQFKLLENEEFGEKVLTVIISERDVELEENDSMDRLMDVEDTITTTVVKGLDEELWKKFLPRFLFLKPPLVYIDTDLGRLLLDEELSGQLYMKGVWVSDLSNENLFAGVDFANLHIDRDRNAVPKPSEIDHQVSCMWIKAIHKDSTLLPKYFHLLQDDKYRDVVHAMVYSDIDTAMLLAHHFIKEYGASATPVLNNTEVSLIKTAVEDLNKDVILCNATMVNILQKSGLFADLSKHNDQTSNNTKRVIIPFNSLDIEGKNILRNTIKLINIVDKTLTLGDVDVVRTNEKELCKFQDNRLEIPNWFLGKQLIHDQITLCQSMINKDSMCYCREIVLCYNILDLLKINKMALPCDIPLHPILFVINHLCQKQNLPVTECNANSDSNSEFLQREASLLKKIEDLEKEKEKDNRTMAKSIQEIQLRLKKTEQELINREVSLVDDEMKIRDGFEKQLKDISLKAEESINLLQSKIKKLEKEKIDLEERLRFKNQQMRTLQRDLDERKRISERQNRTVLDELSHYITQNRHRTKGLLKLSAEGRKSDDVVTKEKWRIIGDLCDMLIEDLQSEKILCCICKTERKTHLLMNCGHYNFCRTCAKNLIEDRGNCPICQSSITGFHKVFE